VQTRLPRFVLTALGFRDPPNGLADPAKKKNEKKNIITVIIIIIVNKFFKKVITIETLTRQV
jgi:hypothetical protein